MGIADSTWPIETEDEVEALARECDWDNRKYMTPTDYAIWCARMRKFARLAAVPSPVATSCEFCIDGLQADGLTPCPCCVNEPAVPAKEWRCFHCDEVFTTENDARLHFGMDQCSVPACKIKMGAEKSLLVALRRAETELQDAWAAIHNENTEAAKAYYAQQSRHGEQLRAAEELGFERGIKDSTKHIAALEEQALRDRKLRDEAQHDALLWKYSVATGDQPPLLVTVWNQRKEAVARATAAERELEIMLQRYERWMPVTGDGPAGFHPDALFEFYCVEDEPEDPENPEYWKTATWAERPTDAVFWCAIVSPRGPHERTFIAYPPKKHKQDAAQ